MNEEHSSFRPRPRIQSLSDLIFGLALSIGALTLIGQQASDFQNLLNSLIYYGFSFLILANVWRLYTNTMDLLPVETTGLVNLNILLLFLVSIEPFLFNQILGSSTSTFAENVSVLYAIDLAGLFLIMAFFTHSLADEDKKLVPKNLLQTYRRSRNFELLACYLSRIHNTSFLVFGDIGGQFLHPHKVHTVDFQPVHAGGQTPVRQALRNA